MELSLCPPLNVVEMWALCSQRVSASVTLYIPHYNSRTGRLIDFIFLWHSGVGWGTCPIKIGRNPIWPLGGSLGFHIPDCNCRLISYFCGIAGWVGGRGAYIAIVLDCVMSSFLLQF
jgi:hypothetical protein